MHEGDATIRAFIERIAATRGSASWFDRFTSDRVVSGNETLHLDVIESKAARGTMVFMPGTNAYAMLYGEYLAAVADRGFNVVGFDPRGHGRSTGRRGSYTVPELMADMRAALRYARHRFGDPLFLSGSSQGGIVAFYLAAEGAPVAGVVCHNIADLPDPASLCLTNIPTISRLAKPFMPLLARVFPEWPVPMPWYINMADEPIRDLGNSRDLLKRGPLLVPYVRLKGLASLSSEPLPAPVEDIHIPVFVVHGGRDRIFPQHYVQGIYNRLTCDKEWLLLEDAHHYVMFDEVPRVVGPICDWMLTHRGVTP